MQPVWDGLLTAYHHVRIRMLEHMMDAAIGEGMNIIWWSAFYCPFITCRTGTVGTGIQQGKIPCALL